MEMVKEQGGAVLDRNEKAWLIWGLGCAFYCYETIVRASPNIMSHELMRDFAMSAATMGLLASFYYWTYAILQIPAGMLLDKLGPHRLLTYSSFICAAGAVIFGWSHYLTVASIGRLLIGVGSAFAAIGTMKLAANWFPTSRFSFLTGLMVAFGGLGGVFGELPLALSVNNYGWRLTMICLGFAGLLITFLIFQVVRDRPGNLLDDDETSSGVDTSPQSLTSLLVDLKAIVTKRQIWLTALFGGLLFAPIPVFCDTWSAAFLMTKYPVDKATAALMASMVYYGLIVGSPLGGYWSDKIKRRKPPMIIAAIGALVTTTVAIYFPIPQEFMYFDLFFFGFFTAGFLPAFSIIREISPQTSTATALGFMNMMNMIFIVIASPLIGYILDVLHNGAIHQGSPLFTTQNYEYALSIIPLGLCVAVAVLPFIKETYAKVQK